MAELLVLHAGEIDGMRKEFLPFVEEALIAVADYWRANFLKKHFTPAGATEYNYAARSEKYERYKSRKKSHKNPLVWSGRGKAEAQANRRVTVTINAGVASIKVSTARVFNLRNPNSKTHPQKEITTVSLAENRVLSEVFRNKLDQLIQNKLWSSSFSG